MSQAHHHFEIAGHPAWKAAFTEKTRDEQLDEDLFASKTVCGVLITIVSLGLLLGIVGVLLAI